MIAPGPAGVHLTRDALDAALPYLRESPRDGGPLVMIVRRPEPGEREVLDRGELDTAVGLVGDNWSRRGSSRTPDNSPHPDMQLNLMNARVLALLSGARERWPLAGDQLIVDLDLATASLPPGSRLAIGSAVVEVTAQPHTGCRKFIERFGLDAGAFVNSPVGRALNLRGINARVVTSGTIAVGGVIHRQA